LHKIFSKEVQFVFLYKNITIKYRVYKKQIISLNCPSSIIYIIYREKFLPVGRCEGVEVGRAVGLGEGPTEGTVLGNAVKKTKLFL
jgi:hypothetical protein